MVDTSYDDVIVVSEEELSRVRNSERVKKSVEVYGRLQTFTLWGTQRAAEKTTNGLYVSASDADRIRDGKAANYDGYCVSVIHEDYAGTPKSVEATADRLFERFKEEEGRAKNVALEALHMLGYTVEKNVSYELREK